MERTAILDNFLSYLDGVSEEERRDIFDSIGEHYCKLCFKKLNASDGETCYCAPGYDE